MTGGGRPLRFLLLVASGWVGARAMMLWPGDPVAAAGRAAIPQVAAFPVRPPRIPTGQLIPKAAPVSNGARMTWPPGRPDRPATPFGTPFILIAATLAAQPALALQDGIVAGLPTPLPPAPDEPRSRFFGSAWAVVRGGNGPAGGVPGVQLGGSQAGVRLGYALRDDRRLALVARATAPLGRGMREAALGVEWQPTRLPVRIVAEQRFALNTGTGGPTLMAVGGIGPLPVAAGFRLEAYAQGGVIGRHGGEGFADGAVRVARPVATIGDVRVDLGAGSWGAAQRGARRIDIGPSLSATLPIGAQPVRLSLDWRQRIMGNAAPGSGLVVTLGADF